MSFNSFRRDSLRNHALKEIQQSGNLGKSLPVVSLTTLGPVNPIKAPGSEILMSPNIA
jgi:hypothetical protein